MNKHAKSMVDERVELLSLVYHLAGRYEYGDTSTEYQRKLKDIFAPFANHPVVEYAKKSSAYYNAVTSYALHLVKDEEKFNLLPNINSLDDRWIKETAEEFLVLLNDFYTQSKFAKFFEEHTSFYQAETQYFVEKTYGAMDFDWFSRYMDINKFHCIYSSSTMRGNYGININDEMHCAIVTGDGGALVHEICHHFANPIGKRWYDENDEFRQWCHDSWSHEKMPQYTMELGEEYATRAYNALYDIEHGKAPFLVFNIEKSQGFVFIEDVYAMITPHEKITLKGKDLIEHALGGAYDIGELQSKTLSDVGVVQWNIISASQPLPYVYTQTDVGNVFDTQTGDIILCDNGTVLRIDVGESNFQGHIVRKYCTIPLYTYNEPLTILASEYIRHFNDEYSYSEMRDIIDKALTEYFRKTNKK